MQEPPDNLVMEHADGGGSGESLVVESVVAVADGAGGDGADEAFLD